MYIEKTLMGGGSGEESHQIEKKRTDGGALCPRMRTLYALGCGFFFLFISRDSILWRCT